MAKYLIEGETLTAIADAIRSKTEQVAGPMTPGNMADYIVSYINAPTSVKVSFPESQTEETIYYVDVNGNLKSFQRGTDAFTIQILKNSIMYANQDCFDGDTYVVDQATATPLKSLEGYYYALYVHANTTLQYASGAPV